jgi:hypothetical protein
MAASMTEGLPFRPRKIEDLLEGGKIVDPVPKLPVPVVPLRGGGQREEPPAEYRGAGTAPRGWDGLEMLDRGQRGTDSVAFARRPGGMRRDRPGRNFSGYRATTRRLVFFLRFNRNTTRRT